ncbi:uncharacterized protein [Pyrus communis]|uniref:uncharacterized protein isoform X2 n=1 Tax=Pyrus communis TaxID=23211 RepID=UPI0035C1A7A7
MAVGRDILKNLNRHKDEDLLKSQAVKNQRNGYFQKQIDRGMAEEDRGDHRCYCYKSKLHAFDQNISEQVASYMRDPSKMVRQVR